MKKIIFIFFMPCILLAQTTAVTSTTSVPGSQSSTNTSGVSGVTNQNNTSNYNPTDPNYKLRHAAESNVDKCSFLKPNDVPGDSELRSLLSTTVNSLQSQSTNSVACTSVGTYISQIYMSLYGVPLNDTANTMQQGGQQNTDQRTVKPTKSGGCLNAASTKVEMYPSTGVNNDPDCLALLNQLEQLQMQLQSCNLKDQSAIAANIGQLTVGVGMILGGNAAITSAGALVQIGSVLMKSVIPSKQQKAQAFIAKINKVEADASLENAMNCYMLSMYQGIYCKKDLSYKKKYEKLLLKYSSTVKKSLKKDIQEQQNKLAQINSDARYAGYDTEGQSKELIKDCYNGYVFLNYDAKKGSLNLEDEPKPFFKKNCTPIAECLSGINTSQKKGWELPVLFTKGKAFSFIDSCETLKKAQALTKKSSVEYSDVTGSLVKDKFNGKTCSTRGPVTPQETLLKDESDDEALLID